MLAEAIAILGALQADLGTLAAEVRVMRGAPSHEVGSDAADLRTVRQEPDMVLPRVLTAGTQAEGDGLETDLVAIQALGDVALHPDVRRLGGSGLITHVWCPS